MPIKINGTNTAANPSITGDDTDTGIVYGSDQIDFSTGGSSKVTLNGSNLGIGTQSPSESVHINGGNLKVQQPAGTEAKIMINEGTTTNGVELKQTATEALLRTFASQPFNIRSQAGSGSTSYLAFWTRDSEKFRVQPSGAVLFGVTSAPNGTSVGGAAFFPENHNRNTLYLATTHNGVALARFYNQNGQVGVIEVSGTSTGYTTSSDYRLKENATAISDGIARIKTLKPYRFNFKADASTTLDGFFAHEVTAVPEAISGEKDAVKEDGSIDPQGIDQSKLVPLLTAALQEAIAKIETLETKVAALEAK